MPPFEAFDVPVRIGLVADTHRRSGSPRGLPLELLRGLDGCDLILHAGDFNSIAVLEELDSVAPTRGVFGNNDEPDLVAVLPVKRFFEIGGRRLGLIHGDQAGKTARQATIAAMKDVVDCVVYGHSHRPDCSREDRLLLVNPGSPTQRRRAPERSYAIMTIDESSKIDVDFVTVS